MFAEKTRHYKRKTTSLNTYVNIFYLFTVGSKVQYRYRFLQYNFMDLR